MSPTCQGFCKQEHTTEIAGVSAVLCKGEGACVPVCPYQAISVKGYTNQEIEMMIDALAREVIREKKDTTKLS
jgi:heterodisulfide reductase subunit A-like polyferredoxin